jgi:ABC-type sugar transport system permease subunit/outer membrane protein assembly factor BamB
MKTQHLARPFLLIVVLALLLVPPVCAQDGGQLWRFDVGGRVQAVSLTADGELLALGARDNLVRVFDRAGQPVWQFTATNSVLGLDLSSDGRWAAVASEDRNVYLLDETGKPLWQHKAERAMNNAAVADDGSLVAATSDDRSFYVLDGKGNLIWRESLGIDVRAVDIYGTGDNARVVIGSDDGYVTIYGRDGDPLLQTRLDYDVQSVAVTPNGARIAAGTSDGLISLIDGSSGKVLWEFRTAKTVRSVAISADGSTILAGSADKKAYLLDGNGRLIQSFPADTEVLAVALSGDGRLLMIGTASNQAQAFDRHAAAANYSDARLRQGITFGGVGLAVVVLIAAGTWAVLKTGTGRRVWQAQTAGPRALLGRIWRARLSYAMILPTLLLLLVFNYYPAFSGLFHAFTDWSPGARTEWVGLANFDLLLHDRFFISSFQNTVILVIVQILKTLTVPLLVAELIFNLRHDKARYWLRTLFIVPLVLPMVVEILLWNNIYDPTIGLLNQTLAAIGRPEWMRTWYGDANVSLASIIFIGFPWVSAFALLIFYGGLIGISEDILDSSKVDGASGWQRFRHIDMPMVMGQVKLLVILNFINAVQTFEVVYLTTGGGPGSATYTPALELYYMAMRMNNMGAASAIGMILFAIILAGTIINMRYVRSSMEYEA